MPPNVRANLILTTTLQLLEDVERASEYEGNILLPSKYVLDQHKAAFLNKLL